MQHLDVIFYYLRKKAKIAPSCVTSFTTADTLFDQSIKREFADFSKDGELNFSFENIITQYILGENVLYGMAWVDVDDVLFPIHISSQEHWVLGRLNFQHRCFFVYNSWRSTRGDALVSDVVKCYSVMLPLFLEKLDFFNGRTYVDRNAGPYANIRDSDSFCIEMVDDLPQQNTK